MRIIGIDITRSIAIFFAMASHIFVDVNLGAFMSPDISMPMRFLFQLATPIFVLLFGTMLELVYFPQWRAGKQAIVSSRLLTRAIQCWLLYALSILALYIVDDEYSLAFSISCLLFMGNSPYTEILKFYAVVLALAPLLLWVRARFGLMPLIVVAVVYQAAWPAIHAMTVAMGQVDPPVQVLRVVKFVTGFGSRPLAGPSVMHGLTLVVAGQCLGWALVKILPGRDADSAATRRANLVLPVMIAGFAVIFAVGVTFVPVGTMQTLTNMKLRIASHPLYFGIGIVSACLASLVFVWAIDVRNIGSKAAWNRLAFFGRTSLFTFSWGNILLYFVNVRPTTTAGAVTMAAVLLVTIVLMSFTFDLVMRRSDRARAALAAVNRPVQWLAQRPFSSVTQPRPAAGV